MAFQAKFDEVLNPFFLHPLDSSNLILVSQPLTGDNYNSWSRSNQLALFSKNKLGFVDGSFPRPPPDSDAIVLAHWDRVDSGIRSWLLSSVSKELVPSIVYNHKVQQTLQKLFKLKILGDLRYFLGLELAKSSKGIYMSQRKYTLALLEGIGFIDCKLASLPMDPNLKLSASDGELLPNDSLYRRLPIIVGSIGLYFIKLESFPIQQDHILMKCSYSKSKSITNNRSCSYFLNP